MFSKWFGNSKAADDSESTGNQEKPALAVVEREKKKVKICCACPETKRLRDLCCVEHGEDAERCKILIEKHLICLRKEGFDV